MYDASMPRTLILRNLPLAARLTLAVFLISVGIGYVSALVQLHFQHASPGSPIPTPQDAVRIFHGDIGGPPLSTLERLVAAEESKPFNGTGQMALAFTTKSERWPKSFKDRNKEDKLRAERSTERDALLAWVRAGANKEDYKEDRYPLSQELANRPLTDELLVKEENKIAEPRAVKIKSLIDLRCSRCHTEGGDDAMATQYPLDTYEHIKPYVTVKANNGMSIEKLAQTTHVHLLGFSMLYGLTGLIVAFSSYPGFVRVLLAPLPLLAQVADISFWWLARLEEPHGPMFARAIAVSGAVVAVGLLLHIVLGLWDLFGKTGKAVLFLLFVGAAAGGYFAKERVIDPYIAKEQAPAANARE
jgi:hypothetical protein